MGDDASAAVQQKKAGLQIGATFASDRSSNSYTILTFKERDLGFQVIII